MWLARLPLGRRACIECGAGRGEIAAFLAPHFAEVAAHDIAPPPNARSVTTASAEEIPADDQSVDLIVSMQALHHFDVPRHVAEVRRVLRPGGVFAALAWGEICLPPRIRRAYDSTLRAIEPFWEAERGWVISGYAGLPFPGTALTLPAAAMVRRTTIDGLDAEIAGWSATQAALKRGAEIVDPDTAAIEPGMRFAVAWPIVGRVFRIYS